MQSVLKHDGSGIAASPPSPSGPAGAMIDDVRRIAETELRPLVVDIDRKGLYPEAVFRALGEAGAFRQHSSLSGEVRLDLAVDAMAAVGSECLSTAFCMWCQDTLVWYLANTPNQEIRDRLLAPVADGRTLGGTGLSNPMKAFFGIESIRLHGRSVPGGYRVSGVLPWVSNIGDQHIFGAIFQDRDHPSRRVMICVDCAAEGMSVAQNARFTALDGTRTFSVRFDNVFVPTAMVLSEPAEPMVAAIRAGFILLQCGMAFGLVEDCIRIMRRMDKSHSHINRYLPERPDALEKELAVLRERVATLCLTPLEQSRDYFRAVAQARLAGSELSLRAAQATMLHSGARGYLADAPAQRRLRESYFVAIVTPATKQLAKMLSDLDNGVAET